MGIEDYTVGSIADLISGNVTPNKPKIVQKKFKNQSSETTVQEQLFNETKQEKQLFPMKTKQKKVKSTPQGKPKKNVNNTPIQRKRKLSENVESEKVEQPKKQKINNSSNSEKRNEKKENAKNEKLVADRTVFVGNIPLPTTTSKLKKLFSKYGNVETVRIRGIPVADVRVPKKVAYIKQQFHPDRTSAHCYVRYSTPEEAHKALILNGELFKDHHLRVRLCDDNKKPEGGKALFIGNVSFKAEEDDIWKLFEPCGKIESVRLIRDSKTGIGKGFGYVNFESSDSVELALQMEKFTLKGRDLRVSIYKGNVDKKKNKQDTIQKKFKKNVSVKKQKQGDADDTESQESAGIVEEKKLGNKTKKHGFQGVKSAEKKKKKKVNKGLLQKKRIVKQLTPKKQE